MRRWDGSWRRRVRRRIPARWVTAARVVRLLALVLAATGCAVEAPRPVMAPAAAAVVPPAPPTPPPALVPPPVISRFGDWHGAGGSPRPWQHSGIDIRVAVGTPVLAAADGTVLRVGSGTLEGKLVIVGHADHLSTVYYHLSQIGVTPGQAVRRGDVIGRSGSTGNATTPHLHFGVCRREDGQCGNRIDAGWADPAAYWSGGTRCFVADRVAAPRRLTYPVPCAKLGRRAAPRDFG